MKENKPIHADAESAKERVELVERVLRQIDCGYLDLNTTDDGDEIGLIRMALCRYRDSIVKETENGSRQSD